MIISLIIIKKEMNYNKNSEIVSHISPKIVLILSAAQK